MLRVWQRNVGLHDNNRQKAVVIIDCFNQLVAVTVVTASVVMVAVTVMTDAATTMTVRKHCIRGINHSTKTAKNDK